jgi:hypothetical protein
METLNNFPARGGERRAMKGLAQNQKGRKKLEGCSYEEVCFASVGHRDYRVYFCGLLRGIQTQKPAGSEGRHYAFFVESAGKIHG